MISMIAEVIASAFATGLIHGRLAERKAGLLSAARRKRAERPWAGFERFLADHPEKADRPYGEALAASLAQEYPCKDL